MIKTILYVSLFLYAFRLAEAFANRDLFIYPATSFSAFLGGF